MADIKYVKGDATQPQGEGNKIIVHICNDIGAWGAGFVIAVSKRWYAPELAYKKLKTRSLGDVAFIRVEDDIIVANMIAQHNVRPDENGNPPIRYDALRICLTEVNRMCLTTGSTIHAPRFGAGLSGGKWEIIEKIIKDVITVDVFIYDLN
jgi:O-acetyl-ADP-ribose deacetylase (regulator of RNase III)